MTESGARASTQFGAAGGDPIGNGAVRDGALAGAISVVVFTAVHHLTISDIWAMLPMMLFAGAACGACVAWTFEALFRPHSLGRWAVWNLAILAALGILAISSVLIYQPVTTMAAIMERGGPVDDLIVQALPLTAAFIVVITGAFSLAFGHERGDYLRLLITTTALTLIVGMNVSVLGLVDFAGGSIGPVLAFFGLIVLLDVAYASAFAILGRRWLTVRPE